MNRHNLYNLRAGSHEHYKDKSAERQKLARDVEEFLAAGGTIQQLENEQNYAPNPARFTIKDGVGNEK